MSFHKHVGCEFVVVCDACRAIGAIGDRDWKKVRVNEDGHALHLCRNCQHRAVWCATHQSYHLPEQLHRRACVLCGGLFTSQVAQQIEHCPSCRRIDGVAAYYAERTRHTHGQTLRQHTGGRSLVDALLGRLTRIGK